MIFDSFAFVFVNIFLNGKYDIHVCKRILVIENNEANMSEVGRC